eukprot:6490739-Amphidinium_carterae.1
MAMRAMSLQQRRMARPIARKSDMIALTPWAIVCQQRLSPTIATMKRATLGANVLPRTHKPMVERQHSTCFQMAKGKELHDEEPKDVVVVVVFHIEQPYLTYSPG